MSTRSRALRGLVAIPALLLVLYVFGMLGLYAWGLHLAPNDIAPARTQAPAHIRTLWLRAEAQGVTRLPKHDPVTLLPRWYLDAKERMEQRRNDGNPTRKAQDLLGVVSRYVVYRGQGDDFLRSNRRHLAQAAVRIHISRNWTLDDAVNTMLIEAEYGRGAIGIDAAAQAYFGVPAQRLREDEALALIALLKGPSWYGFDCGKTRERFAQRFAQFVERLGEDASHWTADSALQRLRPTDCAQRGKRRAQASGAGATGQSR